jgi:small nuclear ribonucleoprotein (snRNP)-like protein
MKKQIMALFLIGILVAASTLNTYTQGAVEQRQDIIIKPAQDTIIQNAKDNPVKQVQATPLQNLQDTIRQKVIVIKNDGSTYSGVILSRDEREILLDTETLGRIYIPLYEISEIKPIKEAGRNSELFATRYFLTTNGLSLGKGNRYYMLSFYGPEVHFGGTDHITVGIMTSWLAMPIIGSLKLSFDAGKNFHVGIGLLAGTLSWAKISSGGILPYGCITIGNYTNNFTLSAGYAWITYPEGQGSAPLLSPACIFKVGRDIFFVLDTFIYLEDPAFAIIMPGLRFARPQKRSSLQFGFGGVAAKGDLVPMPLPVMSWFYKF